MLHCRCGLCNVSLGCSFWTAIYEFMVTAACLCLALMQIDVLVFIQWAWCLLPYYILHSVSPLAAAVHCNDLFYNGNEMIFRRETVLYRKTSNQCWVLNECWVSSKCRNLEATQSCQEYQPYCKRVKWVKF